MHTETCTHTQNNMICIYTHTQANLYAHNNNFIHTYTVTMSSGDGGAILGGTKSYCDHHYDQKIHDNALHAGLAPI